MSVSAPGGAIAALVIALFFVSSCGKTVIDDAKAEDAIEQSVERSAGKKVSGVECPSDVEVEQGASFDCTVSFVGGEEGTARMKILNEDADIELTDLQRAK